MSGILKSFASLLQGNHLKALGFEKRYETFSRRHPEFSEHYHLQPASWNRDGEPWSFHLVIGIGFNAIPARQKGQLAGCHASKRDQTIGTILINGSTSDPQHLGEEVARVAEIILARSEYLQRRHGTLRQSYDRGILHEGFPADPEFDRPAE
jgi:hypothetical protein